MSLLDALIGTAGEPDLGTLIGQLPGGCEARGAGADIEAAHRVMLDPAAQPAARQRALDQWLAKSQPCLFGRLAGRGHAGLGASKGVSYDSVWIHEDDAAGDPESAATRIQLARRAWKDRAETGHSSAFVVIFHGRRLAAAQPGPALVDVCRRLAALYLVEFGRIEPDVVYTEALPLRDANGDLALYKASTQLFYTGAHVMRNHDRRFPGGVAIVVNSPGHLARSLVRRGLHDEESAIRFTQDTALRSIGNGGIGHPDRLSSSWRHPSRSRDASGDLGRFAAAYQVDVLVQADVVGDPRPRFGAHDPGDVWPDLHLEYLNAKATTRDDPDFGWHNGLPVDDAAKYHNPWTPRHAENSPDFDY